MRRNDKAISEPRIIQEIPATGHVRSILPVILKLSIESLTGRPSRVRTRV
jgi:hypothetical protein